MQAGYSVGLYARVKGIDNKKAYRELLDKECFSIQKSNITISPINEIADIDKRDAIYRTFLNMLKLEKSSKLALNRLGFLNSTIEEQMYRTIPNKSIHRRLIAYRLSKLYDLSGIPGFYQEADRYLGHHQPRNGSSKGNFPPAAVPGRKQDRHLRGRPRAAHQVCADRAAGAGRRGPP